MGIRHFSLERRLEMRREYGCGVSDVPFAENLIFYAPLTTDGRDVIGGLLPSSDSSAVTYSPNGVRITSSPRINFQYLISNELVKSTKCIYAEYFNLGSAGTYQYVLHFGYRPTSSSYNGGYRMMYNIHS